MTDDTLTLTITRTFLAPRALVFDAWTNPQSSVGWWGPRGLRLDVFESDLRVGGRWRIAMRSAQGERMVNGGVYRDIAAPGRLAMTHAWEDADGRLGPETLITIVLTEREGGTEMAFVQTGFETSGGRDGHRLGWGEAFDALATALVNEEER